MARFLRCCCHPPSSCQSWAVVQWGTQAKKCNHARCWLCKLKCLYRKSWHFHVYFQEKHTFPMSWEKSLVVPSSLGWRVRLHLAYSLFLTPLMFCLNSTVSQQDSELVVSHPLFCNLKWKTVCFMAIWYLNEHRSGMKSPKYLLSPILGGCILVLNPALAAGHLW